MSWIRSEQSLLHHPKTVTLKALLKVDTATVIGRLHMLWWWCLDYAIDGDLSKKDPKVIEDCCQIPLKLLIKSGFADSRPYRRIHGWYEIQGNYLRARFKDKPEIWHRIKELYANDLPMSLHRSNHEGNNPSNNPRSTTDVQTYGRTYKRTYGSTSTSRARPAPLAGASAPREPTPEELEQQEANRTWQKSTVPELPESQRMTPDEMKKIRMRNLGKRSGTATGLLNPSGKH